MLGSLCKDDYLKVITNAKSMIMHVIKSLNSIISYI